MSAPCPIFGFVVHVSPKHDASALRNELGARLAQSGLVVSRTGSRALELVVTREGMQATESDRQLVIALLNEISDAGVTKVSELIDLSY